MAKRGLGNWLPAFGERYESHRTLVPSCHTPISRRQDAPDLNLDALTSERIFGGERSQA